jgi:hypothetical protein
MDAATAAMLLKKKVRQRHFCPLAPEPGLGFESSEWEIQSPSDLVYCFVDA